TGPTARVPIIRCARISRVDIGRTGLCETHRILLFRVLPGGESSGKPKTRAAMRSDAPRAYGITGRSSLKPVRAHVGSTAVRTSGEHGAADGRADAGGTSANTTSTRAPRARVRIAVVHRLGRTGSGAARAAHHSDEREIQAAEIAIAPGSVTNRLGALR